jgi:acyl homoserine lactone synthase
VSALGKIVAEGRTAVPPQFLTDMTVNRALVRDSFEIGEEFLEGGSGLDAFDNDDAHYVIVYDKTDGGYLGSVRMNPTTGPNMLRDAMPYLLASGATVESPSVWEMSRMCAMTDIRDREARHSADVVVGELLCGAVEDAKQAGVREIVCIADDSTLDTLDRMGCLPRLMPRPAVGPGRAPYVAVFDVGEIPLRRIEKTSQTSATVVEFGRKLRDGH